MGKEANKPAVRARCGRPEGPGPKRTRKKRWSQGEVDQSSREFAVALWRIAHGKPGPGGMPSELAKITGMSPETIRYRANEASRNYPPDPSLFVGGLTSDDLDYSAALRRSEDSPEVRDWLGGISTGQRVNPDREDARVTRQRIGDRLISITKDIPEH